MHPTGIRPASCATSWNRSMCWRSDGVLTMFRNGPGSDAINNNCLACHSADMVLNQPALSKQAWAAEVNKMINNYKAPVAPEDVATIVEYLTGLRGAK